MKKTFLAKTQSALNAMDAGADLMRAGVKLSESGIESLDALEDEAIAAGVTNAQLPALKAMLDDLAASLQKARESGRVYKEKKRAFSAMLLKQFVTDPNTPAPRTGT